MLDPFLLSVDRLVPPQRRRLCFASRQRCCPDGVGDGPPGAGEGSDAPGGGAGANPPGCGAGARHCGGGAKGGGGGGGAPQGPCGTAHPGGGGGGPLNGPGGGPAQKRGRNMAVRIAPMIRPATPVPTATPTGCRCTTDGPGGSAIGRGCSAIAAPDVLSNRCSSVMVPSKRVLTVVMPATVGTESEPDLKTSRDRGVSSG
jgi:hypothetical protein